MQLPVLEPVCFLLLIIVIRFFLYIISYGWLQCEVYSSLHAYHPQLQDTIPEKYRLRVVVKCFQDRFTVLKFIISEQKTQTELQRDKISTYISLENMQCLLTESGVNHMQTWGEGRVKKRLRWNISWTVHMKIESALSASMCRWQKKASMAAVRRLKYETLYTI